MDMAPILPRPDVHIRSRCAALREERRHVVAMLRIMDHPLCTGLTQIDEELERLHRHAEAVCEADADMFAGRVPPQTDPLMRGRTPAAMTGIFLLRKDEAVRAALRLRVPVGIPWGSTRRVRPRCPACDGHPLLEPATKHSRGEYLASFWLCCRCTFYQIPQHTSAGAILFPAATAGVEDEPWEYPGWAVDDTGMSPTSSSAPSSVSDNA